MSLCVSHCPHCVPQNQRKLEVIDSRAHFSYGFPTVRRRRACTKCDFRVTTIELPIKIGNEIFKDD